MKLRIGFLAFRKASIWIGIWLTGLLALIGIAGCIFYYVNLSSMPQ